MTAEALKVMLYELVEASTEYRNAELEVANYAGLNGKEHQIRLSLAKNKLKAARERLIGAEALAMNHIQDLV
jgi:hypothetical protein